MKPAQVPHHSIEDEILKHFGGDHPSNISRFLLLSSGFILILCGLLHNEFLMGLLDPNPPLAAETASKIRSTQLYFLLSGVVLISISECVRKISWLNTLMKKRLVTNILLATLSVLLPLFILEFSLRPYAFTTSNYKVTIFVRDRELGWKLKPNSEDMWGGVRVRINGKGLRGPELDYAKPPHVKRVLYLGDSVVFGFGLESFEQTFPYLVETMLEDRHKYEYEIETINTGVGGYSPWQEYLYLSNEGIKYEPDLIVISFVLNDVIEKLELTKFGGWGEGFQLSQMASTLERLSEKSSIFYFSRQISARIRFGSAVQQGAQQQEAFDVKDLVDYPDRPDILRAWKITNENLSKIFDFSKDRNIPVILVVFPYTFQFESTNTLSMPQEIIKQLAFYNEIPVIDMLPILRQKMEEQKTQPDDYFFDFNHLSPDGSEIVAEIIASYIHENHILDFEQTSVLTD